MMTTYSQVLLGKVSWPPANRSSYVRVGIPQCGEPELSIKATFDGYDRLVLHKGQVVEVQRSNPNDARRYKVVRVVASTGHTVVNVAMSGILNEDSQADGETILTADYAALEARYAALMLSINSSKNMRFFLPRLYFQAGSHCSRNGMWRATCVRVLASAMDMPGGISGSMMDKNPEGFWIVCTTDQFARFIVFRHEAGECINGIRDLKPSLGPTPDFYDRLAKKIGVSRATVEKVTGALGYTADETPTDEIDVTPRTLGHSS